MDVERGVAYQMANELAAIRLGLELLRPSDREQQVVIEALRASTDRLAEISEQLQDDKLTQPQRCKKVALGGRVE